METKSRVDGGSLSEVIRADSRRTRTIHRGRNRLIRTILITESRDSQLLLGQNEIDKRNTEKSGNGTCQVPVLMSLNTSGELEGKVFREPWSKGPSGVRSQKQRGQVPLPSFKETVKGDTV